MKKQLIEGLALGLVAMCMTGTASAASLSVTHVTGTVNTTTALTGYATNGAMMDNMAVTAFFADGSSETLAWADWNSTSGGVVGHGWSLGETGDTFGSNWALKSETASIRRILLDAGVGDSVFDTTFIGDVNGTAGSYRGRNFTLTSTNNWDIVATYRDAVALGAALPVGDLFRRLSIDFSNGRDFGAGQSLTFIADTDNLRFAGDIHAAVPEPETYAMLLAGLGLLGFTARRRKQGV
jgi:hypothetical protein